MGWTLTPKQLVLPLREYDLDCAGATQASEAGGFARKPLPCIHVGRSNYQRCRVPEAEKSDIHGNRPAAASQQGMADHKELATFAFQSTRMPIVISDARQPDYPIVLANDSFLELTGYAANELVGRNCRLLQGEDLQDGGGRNPRADRAGTAGDSGDPNYRKNGTTFWNQLHLSPIRDDDGRLAYYFASQVDVTDYRRTQTLEEVEHRLLLEVDHRTKNVLAIVDSIVRLSRSDNAAAYAASVQQRVQALSRTHMLLAENGWQQASLDDIVRHQVRVFGSDGVDIDGPRVMVPAPSVQPIGLRSTNLPPMLRSMAPCREGEAVCTFGGGSRAMALSSTGGKAELAA
jgi:PAS domain S-box-containing protein